MSYIKEKVSYLKGLADGLTIADEAQQKLFAAIIDALDAIADAVEDNESAIDEMNEFIEDICDDLDALDEAVFEDEDEDEEDDDDFVEVVCPHCDETIFFDQEMLESADDLICPNCNQPVITPDPGGDED
ncbi:MAG: CD1247 N-terminal domain-containing protein [Bacillota bacterium]